MHQIFSQHDTQDAGQISVIELHDLIYELGVCVEDQASVRRRTPRTQPQRGWLAYTACPSTSASDCRNA